MSIAASPLARRRFRVAPSLSRDARRRLRWMEFYLAHARRFRLTCRHFGISSGTFYRWWGRYDPRRLESLEDDRHTRRPRRGRQPQTPAQLVAQIRTGRERYPRWGKAKLAVVLRREGWHVSVSTVGRTLTRLRALGQLQEPVEVLPGLRRIHFTARDVVSRKDVLAAYTRTTSQAATQMLREAFGRFGFRVRAIQIDGGSEFKATFEAACRDLRIRLYVLPPRSPRLNGHVERAHRTHQEEFYDLSEIPEGLAAHNALLRAWEETYNNVRPHQALGYLTPNEYLARWQATHR